MPAASVSSRLDLRAGARLLRFIRREHIAMVHCHLFTASLVGAGPARMAGVGAVIETCHGPEVWRMGKGLRARFWVDRQIGRLVDTYIAVSHAAAHHLIATKRVPDSKVRVIHNGRDLDRFAPADSQRRSATRAALGLGDEPACLTLARLDDQKGHRHLIDALAILAPRRPDLVALLAGEGPLRAGLARAMRRAGARLTACDSSATAATCPSCSRRPTWWSAVAVRGPAAGGD